MHVLRRHPPVDERRHQAFHHCRWPADVELVAPVRQRAAQQVDVDATGMLEVAARFIARTRLAVDHVEVERSVLRSQLLEDLLEGVVCAVAHAVVQVHRARRLRSCAPAQHAHHGRDADAAAHQHRGHAGVGVDEEPTRRRLDLQHVAFAHLVVKVGGRQARGQLWPTRRRRHALDGDPVARRIGPIRQRVAPGDRSRRCQSRRWRHRLRRSLHCIRRAAAACGDAERQVLARQEGRQRQSVDRRQMERALRLRWVFEQSPHHAELTPPCPGAAGRLRRSTFSCWQRHCSRSVPAPNHDHADPCDQLQQQRREDPA